MGMDIWGANGNYFRANIWQWRSICYAMSLSGFEVPQGWHFNNGEGLRTEPDCIDLAEKLTQFLSHWDDDVLVMESDVRVNKDGCFVDPGTPGSRSAYRVRREHLEEFVVFLRNCGGLFEIR